MAKVNEFETAEYIYNTAGAKQRFPDEANEVYRYADVDSLLADTGIISKMIQHHAEVQVPRLQTLENYYKGNNTTILQANRRKEEHLSDHRASHNFAKYVSGFIQGYMVGVPLKTTYPDDEAIDEDLRERNRINDADEHNSNLVLDQSIYGRAYELLYRSKDDITRFTLSDVKETFVIYDNTVEMEPIAAVRYFNNGFEQDNTNVQVYTDSNIYNYTMESQGNYELTANNSEPHYFNGVPIIEYTNNRFRQGDFEDALNLIDLYDAAQSDTANYMQDFNDSMLKIIGNLDIDVEDAQNMKKHNILMLRTEPNAEGREGQAEADYIYKQYDVSGTEAYKTRILNDILMFTSIPNMLDENFGGNQSGEAIKMKLFALSQKRATKERLFKRGLRNRYRLINNIAISASERAFDVNKIDIQFTENLPRSVNQEMDWFSRLGGRLSEETLLGLLSFIENPKEEMEKKEREAEENRQNAVNANYQFRDINNEQENQEAGGNANGEDE